MRWEEILMTEGGAAPCPDCGQTVGLADDRRSVWDAIAAHSCQVVA